MFYFRQKTETRRDPALLSNNRPTKRPRPNKRPLRPGHVQQVTISSDAAAQIIQEHENLAPATGEPVPIEVGQPLAVQPSQPNTAIPLVPQQPTKFIPGLRPQLPLFFQPYFPNFEQPAPVHNFPIQNPNDRLYSPFEGELKQTPFLQNSQENQIFPSQYNIQSNPFFQFRQALQPQQGPEINPFTKEALWHKDFLQQQQMGMSLPQAIQNIPQEYVNPSFF